MGIKVIQVGVAGFGDTWRHGLTTTPGVDVVALVDIDRDALKEAADFFGVPKDRCFLNPDKTWAEVDADVVIDASPQFYHHTNAMQAFAGGKNLIVVKPMSDQWETGVAMVKEAEKRELKMVVAQQLRFHPVILKVREIVKSGILGQIGYIHLDAFFGKAGYSGSHPQPYPLLVQASIHHFDYIRWVLGQDAVAVWADNWNPPWIEEEDIHCAYVAIEMAGGCRVCYRGIATNDDHMNWTCNWRVEGDKGILKVINDRLYLDDEELYVEWEEDIDISDLNLPVLNKIILERFIDYLEKGDEPGFSGRNNLNSMEIAFGAIKSSETEQRYRMDQ